MSDTKTLHIGNLPTVNDEEYQGLGQWWVQIWDGDNVVARVYGETPQAARAMAERLAAQAKPATPTLIERHELVTAIIHRLERACGTGTMPPTLIAREFLGSAPERPEASAVLRRWHAIGQAMLDAGITLPDDLMDKTADLLGGAE